MQELSELSGSHYVVDVAVDKFGTPGGEVSRGGK